MAESFFGTINTQMIHHTTFYCVEQADLKRIYKASTKDLAESELDILADKWNDKYPIVITSWRNNWERLSQYFIYPEDIRRVIYATNIIEAVHRQFRKLTKTKGTFSQSRQPDEAPLYGNPKRRQKVDDAGPELVSHHFSIGHFFEGRLDKELKF